jgi:hypothetical protein
MLGTLSQRDPPEELSMLPSDDDEDEDSSRNDELVFHSVEAEACINMTLGTGISEEALSSVIVTSLAFVSRRRSFMKTSNGCPIFAALPSGEKLEALDDVLSASRLVANVLLDE